MKTLLREAALHTVCEEARCPNLGECFSKGIATFLILGRICTRNCGFCSVEHGDPLPLNDVESEKVAQAAQDMGLRYAVVTSVTRDDLIDGGAFQFARTIRVLRTRNEKMTIEVLIPDFGGKRSALQTVLRAHPDVLNHNVETVARLYPMVRPNANYQRSLGLLQRSKEIAPSIPTKSGLMLGLGETHEEVLSLLKDLREVGCDFVTIGQYLQPCPDRLAVVRYLPPEQFREYQKTAEGLGFKGAASGPFVRSSYQASEMFEHSGLGKRRKLNLQ